MENAKEKHNEEKTLIENQEILDANETIINKEEPPSPNSTTSNRDTTSIAKTIIDKKECQSTINTNTTSIANTILSATTNPFNDANPSQRETRVQSRSKVGKEFLHYKIEKELGRGGMGVVYKAFDTRLQRYVALKLILKSLSNDLVNRRFIQEAQATAQLEHPYIVKLLEIGEEPEIYFTMEYIEGKNLSEAFQEKKFSYKETAEIIRKIAEALQVANDKGFIHRDIKPSNIMLKDNNIPKLMDFGLAKNVDIENSLSKTGDMVGTPVYMPPEQAQGKKIDFRCDIYALGTTLYHLLTGRPPFQGESYVNILHQVLHSDPLLPHKLNPDIPGELEAICLKCMEKNPEHRYPTATSLSQDLQNFLDGKPVSARSATPAYLLKRLILRHLSLVVTILVLATFIVSGIVFSFSRIKQLAQEANVRLAKIAYEKANEACKERKWDNAGVLAGTTIQLLKNINTSDSQTIASNAQNVINSSLIHHGLLWKEPLPQNKNISHVKMDPMGKYVLVCWDDNTIKIWRINKGLQQEDLIKSNFLQRETNDLVSLCFSFDSSLVVAAFSNGDIRIWDINEQTLFEPNVRKASVEKMVASDEENVFAIIYKDKNIILWDNAKQKITQKIHFDTKSLLKEKSRRAKKEIVASLQMETMLSSDLKYAAFRNITKKYDWIIELWDIQNKTKLHEYSGYDNLYGFGKQMFFTSSHGDMYLYDINSPQKKLQKITIDEAKSICFTENNTIIAFDCSTLNKWKLTEISKEKMDKIKEQQLNQTSTNYTEGPIEQTRFNANKPVRNKWDAEKLTLQQFHNTNNVIINPHANLLITTTKNYLLLWLLDPEKLNADYHLIRYDLFNKEKMDKDLQDYPQQTTELLFEKRVNETFGITPLNN